MSNCPKEFLTWDVDSFKLFSWGPPSYSHGHEKNIRSSYNYKFEFDLVIVFCFVVFFFSIGRFPILDIGFVVDSSDDANWQQTLDAISSLVDDFDVSQNGVQVAVIPFSSSAVVAVPFPEAEVQRYTPEAVKQSINSIPQQGGSERRVDLALQVAYDDLFKNRSRKTAAQVCTYVSSYFIFSFTFSLSFQ